MNTPDESTDLMIARIATAGEQLDVPPIDLDAVVYRVVQRRRRRVIGVVSGVLVGALVTVGGVHLATLPTPPGKTARPAVVSGSSVSPSPAAGLGAGPACAGPGGDLTPLFSSAPRIVDASHPLMYTLSSRDTPEAAYVSGGLYLGKAGLGRDARLPNGIPAATVATYQQARAELREVSPGRWTASLRVIHLPRGSYPFVIFTHYRYLGTECVLRGGSATYSSIAALGYVTVK